MREKRHGFSCKPKAQNSYSTDLRPALFHRQAWMPHDLDQYLCPYFNIVTAG